MCFSSAIFVFKHYCRAEEIFPGKPSIISRAEWKAVEPDIISSCEKGLYNVDSNPAGWEIYDRPLNTILRTVVIHHTALSPAEGVKRIQYIHMHNKCFADIAYHFVIDGEGRIFEGRNISVRGAHTSGYNTGTIGVALQGNFEESSLPLKQYQGLLSLLGLLKQCYNIQYVAGHQDFLPGKTVCPGKNVESLLAQIAKTVGLKVGIVGYVRPIGLHP